MTKKEKVLNFMKKHKKEFLTGFAIGAVGGIMYALGKTNGEIIGIKKTSDLALDCLSEGTVMMPGFTIEGGLKISDIGKLGEDFIKHDKELTLDTEILEVGHFVFE